jgi:hypothetical protein
MPEVVMPQIYTMSRICKIKREGRRKKGTSGAACCECCKQWVEMSSQYKNWIGDNKTPLTEEREQGTRSPYLQARPDSEKKERYLIPDSSSSGFQNSHTCEMGILLMPRGPRPLIDEERTWTPERPNHGVHIPLVPLSR